MTKPDLVSRDDTMDKGATEDVRVPSVRGQQQRAGQPNSKLVPKKNLARLAAILRVLTVLTPARSVWDYFSSNQRSKD